MNLNSTSKCSKLFTLLLLFLSSGFGAFAQGDLCTDPIVITEGTHTADTLVGEGAVQAGAVAAKWYSFTPAANVVVTVSSCLGGTDTRLYIWSGGCDLATNTLEANNDDFCELEPGGNAWASEASFLAIGGTEYLINWDDRWDASGFEFTVSTSTPPMVDVTVSVDMSAVMTAADGAHIAGSFNGWTGEPMTDNGDDTYSFTIAGVSAGTTVEYKFQNGLGGWENDFSSDLCGQNNNRFFQAPLESVALPIVPFNACFFEGESCLAPIVVSEGTHTVDTLTGSGGEGYGDDADVIAAKWYSYTPAEDGFVNVNSCLGGTDTRLWVWTGDCDPATITLVAQNDDFCEFAEGSSAWASQVEFEATAGTEYLINWNDEWDASGFDFSITLNALPPDPTCDAPAFLIEDDIESYDLGDVNGAAGHWSVWTGAASSGVVSEDFAASGTKSVKIDGSIAGQDALLLLNNASSGHYWVGWKMYVPEGGNAYFNLQHDATPGGSFGFEALFNAGVGTFDLFTETIVFEYPEASWFDVILLYDIDNDEARMVIGDVETYASIAVSWPFSNSNNTANSGLAAINFFPLDDTYVYYIDDVAFALLPDAEAGQYCYTAEAAVDGVNTVPEATCFGGGYQIDNNSSHSGIEGLGGYWFTYTPSEDGVLTLSSCGGGADTRGWIFGGDCQSLSIVGVNDDQCDQGDGNPYASYREAIVTGGTTYYILWDDIWDQAGFDFELTLTPGDGEAGLFCQTAIPVEVNVDIFAENFGHAAATGLFVDNSSASSPTAYAQTAWYTFTPTESDTVTLTSCDAGSDTRVWVYTGSCGTFNDLTLIASADDGCDAGLGSLIEDWVVEAGTTYYIEWDDHLSSDPFIWRIEKEIVIDVDELDLSNGVNVFPNPATDQLFVQFDLSEAVDMEVHLVNILGQTVASKTLDAVQGETIDFNVSNFAAGTYFVQFVTENASTSQKVILQD